MPRAPAFSVIIASYNHRDFLPLALASVYAQTEADFEVVLIDDHSTDGTARWLRSQRDPRLRWSVSPRNRGAVATRNAALRRAKGRLIAFLDSDDQWEPGYLAALRAAFADPRVQLACSDLRTIDAEGRVIRRAFYRRNPKVRDPRFEGLSGLPFCPGLSSCVARRSALKAVGGFDEGFRRIHDDRDLLYRLARRYGPAAFRFVPQDLARHRRHERQETGFIERGDGYLPSRSALARWAKLGRGERDLILDVVYFSLKQDCRHCDRLRGGLHSHGPARARAGRSRTRAPAP